MAKTKSNPQSNTTKPPVDDAASEKLHSLKSLNAMLLKETVERRQQVDSLTQINKSLESELNRCSLDKDLLELELNGVNERAVMLEIENRVSSRFVEVQLSEMEEVIGKESGVMLERVDGLERDLKRVVEEKSVIERVKEEKELEIGCLIKRLSVLEGEIGEEKFILLRVSEERDAIRAQLDERVGIESLLRLQLVEAVKRESVVVEKLRKSKVDYDGLVLERSLVERKMEEIMREKDLINRNFVESNELIIALKNDFKNVNEEKLAIERERDLQEKKKNTLQDLVDGLNESVHMLQQEKMELLMKVGELEKKCVVSSDDKAKMSAEIDILVKEKQEIELGIQKLTQEKDLVTKDLDEALKNLRQQNLAVNRLDSEKTKLNDAKNQAETDIIKLKEQLEELKNSLKTLEKVSIVQTDKIKQLESENSCNIAAFDQATKERNSARVSLDGEKHKVKSLSENISKMEKDIQDTQKKLTKMQKDNEKLVAEKKDLENKRAVLENEISVIKKLLAQTQKDHDDIQGKLRLYEANTSKIFKIMKEDNKGGDQETEVVDEIKRYVTKVEAIKKALKDKESVADEMKNQLELLNVRVAKADKGKSFWAMVSSATTILAAVSLAYVARAGY
ncbi:hypothetical protein QVD17_18997 [Tagetes erecta]|uniref:Uncharacterized protein n=1 Tax=Tagetes erecta TaxID=13708 RepID=A0AAD8KIR0_TARER|nr:hypothetical protein QVD17_18997 [Tagetes erecta]